MRWSLDVALLFPLSSAPCCPSVAFVHLSTTLFAVYPGIPCFLYTHTPHTLHTPLLYLCLPPLTLAFFLFYSNRLCLSPSLPLLSFSLPSPPCDSVFYFPDGLIAMLLLVATGTSYCLTSPVSMETTCQLQSLPLPSHTDELRLDTEPEMRPNPTLHHLNRA